MKEEEKKQLGIEKKQFSVKIMYFNRYLAIRYLTAGFFFVNLNWLLVLLFTQSNFFFLPVLLLLLIFPAMGEQIRLYRNHLNTAPRTKKYVKWQGIGNSVLICSIFTPFYTAIFPFMANDLQGKVAAFVFLGGGIVLCRLWYKRLEKIQGNQDRQYQRIKKFEQVAHVGKENN